MQQSTKESNNQTQPNSRFNSYTELIKKGKVIGFKLDDNDFQFIFDEYGGWFDEVGKYYNQDAIECSPPMHDDDSSNEEQVVQIHSEQKNSAQIDSFNLKKDQRLQTVQTLQNIISNYPQKAKIHLILTTEPKLDNEAQMIEKFITQKLHSYQKSELQKKQLNYKFDVYNGTLITQDHLIANFITELQGSKVKSQSTLYIDIDLYNSVDIYIKKLKEKQVIQTLQELGFEKDRDFGNIEEDQYKKGKFECFVQINKNILKQVQNNVQGVQLANKQDQHEKQT